MYFIDNMSTKVLLTQQLIHIPHYVMKMSVVFRQNKNTAVLLIFCLIYLCSAKRIRGNLGRRKQILRPAFRTVTLFSPFWTKRNEPEKFWRFPSKAPLVLLVAIRCVKWNYSKVYLSIWHTSSKEQTLSRNTWRSYRRVSEHQSFVGYYVVSGDEGLPAQHRLPAVHEWNRHTVGRGIRRQQETCLSQKNE